MSHELHLAPMMAMIAGGLALFLFGLELMTASLKAVAGSGLQTALGKLTADPRKTWKLSPMDLESHRRWYDYSRARDAMFAATDTKESPWHVVKADDKRRARLNCIAHFLDLIPYEEILPAKADLPTRHKAKGYEEPDYPYHFVPEKY